MQKGFNTHDTGPLATLLGFLAFLLYGSIIVLVLYTTLENAHNAKDVPEENMQKVRAFQQSQRYRGVDE